MGGQVTRHGQLINGPVPITSLPSGLLRHKHNYDCSVPITSQSPSSQLHHHFEPIDCPGHITTLRHNKHVLRSSHQPWFPLNQDPLLFHPTVKGSQIVMDESQRIVRRRGSFCNAIVFSDRSVAVNEVVRLKITHTHQAWQGALRIGFTTQDPSMMHPKSLPRYSCPDLASKSDFWAKPLPEELLNTESVISFWISKKGRVLYRINEGTPKRLFRQVSSYLPLWVFVDVYGKTKGVQLLDSETLPQDVSIGSTRSRLTFPKKKNSSQLPVHLWNMFEDGPEEDDRYEPQCVDHTPQNSQNLRLCSELPEHLDDELRFHHVHGEHIRLEDPHTAVMLKHQGPDRTLVFTSRPLEQSESVFIMVHTAGPAELSYGVTACNPAALRPQDLPTDLVWLLDRMEFWAVDNFSAQLSNEDILGFELNAAGEVIVSRNGFSLGVQLCVDNSRPLWMFFMPHKNLAQLKIFGLSSHSDVQGPPRSPVFAVPSLPASPLSATNTVPNITSSRLVSSSQPSTASDQPVQPRLRSRPSAIVTPSAILSSQRSHRFSTDTEQNPTPSSPSSVGPPQASDECAICCDDTVDTVLYDCGHLCLCYKCALKLKQDKAPCPICRKPIRDIIRTYKCS
ncbi:E3 ubiquitin-protein ligase NEURL1-like isoform X2 [Syngnathus acus]|uniref:E3 ubiquitin-protein ligase NEURL1-like isoform X2 n=1 Tax=Syngnathus acus TaxID=161584 RepID=UPI0018860AD3|nr:E3 ubiquitin-protein ligase NEURL1-like isoform X2 [Syngnathus acus]